MNLRRLFFIPFLLSFTLLAHSAYGLTISEEKKYGKEVFAEISRSATINNDPYVSIYVQEIKSRLEDVAGLPFPVVLTIIESGTVDAFATVGGYVFITTGLIGECDREEELAGVMAHEFAHVKKRHIAKRLEKQKFINIGMLATMVAGMLIGDQAGGAVATAGSASAQALSLRYSREDEEEADKEGSVIASRAGYGGLGIADFLKKIRAIGGDKFLPQYLLTHPYHESRIVTLENMWPNSKVTVNTTFFPYVLVRAKLFGKAHGPGIDEVLVNRYLKARDDPVNAYAASLIFSRKGKADESIQIASHIDSPYRPLLLGETLINARRYDGAIEALRDDKDPIYRYFLARAYEGNGNREMAVTILKTLIPYGSGYPEILYRLAMLLGRMGDEGQGFEYLGRYYLEMGRYDLARSNFEKAITKYGINSYQAREVMRLMSSMDEGKDAKK
ncbi:MAG: M48 family metalloprotease [Syntrophorhabdaceae bacterium]|nr:M48 family metalloprotease [Syntrophorhabdaceae bacterium]